MENIYKEKGDDEFSFLKTPDAKRYFAEIDYYLKNGMHIQKDFPKPEGLYRFLDRYSIQIKKYYWDLFQIVLTYGGEEWNRYYFIDFIEGNRGNILSDNREYVPVQHLIIGLLLINIYKIDAHLEMNSISGFKQILREDYEEYKNDLYRLLADSESNKDSDYSDKKIDGAIDSAFKFFSKVGWISLYQSNEFKVMPSIERLRKMYETQIVNIEDIFKSTVSANDLPENL